jgi:hypothetical protein
LGSVVSLVPVLRSVVVVAVVENGIPGVNVWKGRMVLIQSDEVQ